MAPRGSRLLAAACLGLCATGQEMYMSSSGNRCGHDGLRCPHRCLEVVPLYGNLDAYGYYFANLWVGAPEQRVSAIVDTTSHLFSFACTTCEHCGRHLDPAFNPNRSRTASWMSCGVGCPGHCLNGKCSYKQSFAEGSAIMATFLTEQVRFGDDHHGIGPSRRTEMACHDREEKQFYTQKVNGFLGLSAGKALASLSNLPPGCGPPHMSYSLCLSEWGGQLQLPGIDMHGQGAHAFSWTPLLSVDHKGLHVYVTGIEVRGRNLFFPREPRLLAQLDSGTTFTYLPTRLYLRLRSMIEGDCAGTHSGPCNGAIRRGQTCWYFPDGPRGLNRFPPVVLHLGKLRVMWRPQGYMYRNSRGTNTWCYAFEDDGPNAQMVLGLSFFLHRELVFDISGSRLGFRDARCPIIKERADAPAGAPEPSQAAAFRRRPGDSGPAGLRGAWTTPATTTSTMPPWRAAAQGFGLALATPPPPLPVGATPYRPYRPYAEPGGGPEFYPPGAGGGSFPAAGRGGSAGGGWTPGMMPTTADPAKEQAEEVLEKVREVGDVVQAVLNDNVTLSLQQQLGPLLHRLPRWGSLASGDAPPPPPMQASEPAPPPPPMQDASTAPQPPGEGAPRGGELPLPKGVTDRKLAIVSFAIAAGAVLLALFFAGVALGALSHARMARSSARELRDSLLQCEGEARGAPPPVEMEAVLPKPAYAQPPPVLAPAASAEAVAFAQEGEAAEDGGVL